MTKAPTPAGSRVEADHVVFRLEDPGHAYDSVRLWSIVSLAQQPIDLTRDATGWQTRLPLPDLARVEYLFEVRESAAEETQLIVDPGNERRVEGAFGAHSWLPMPGYAPPAWLDWPTVEEVRTPLSVVTPAGPVEVLVWSPADAAPKESLPLLLSHDGPEMDAWGRLTHFVGAHLAKGQLPRMRVALLTPGPRDERYAANQEYAAALVAHVLPAVTKAHPSAVRPVLIGQSLGGLAALHAEWSYPGTFAAVASQSGSFFTPELDAHESDFAGWDAVTGFVNRVLTEPPPSRPQVSLTCGSAEENLANNRLVAKRLTDGGVPVAWGEVADGHCYTTWRDLLDPHLRNLLALAWS